MILRVLRASAVAAALGVGACSTHVDTEASASRPETVISAAEIGGPGSGPLAELRTDTGFRKVELVVVMEGRPSVLDRWEHFPSGASLALKDASVDGWPVVALVMVDEPADGYSNVRVDLYDLKRGIHIGRIEGSGADPVLKADPGESCSLVTTHNPYAVENPAAGLWPRCHRVIRAGGGIRLDEIVEGRVYCGLLRTALTESRTALKGVTPEAHSEGWAAAERQRLVAHIDALTAAVNSCASPW